MKAKYQVMRDLTSEEYRELKKDIADRGVMVPIEFDEDGNVLDGHNRLKICEELGITEYPKIIRTGMTEEEKRFHARALNIARRQLNREEKQEQIREQLKETPEKSDRQIASGLGVSDKTVGVQRRLLEGTAEIPQLKTNIGADGKERPRTSQRKGEMKEKEMPEKIRCTKCGNEYPATYFDEGRKQCKYCRNVVKHGQFRDAKGDIIKGTEKYDSIPDEEILKSDTEKADSFVVTVEDVEKSFLSNIHSMTNSLVNILNANKNIILDNQHHFSIVILSAIDEFSNTLRKEFCEP